MFRKLRLLLVIALIMAVSVPVTAQEKYPNRPVMVIIPYSAGGNADVMGRAFLNVQSRVVGNRFVVENRAGAAGTIGFAHVAAAKPDGYTLGFGPNSAMSSAPHVMAKLPFTYDDFQYVCQVFENIFVVAVAPNSRFKSFEDIVQEARKNPGKVTFGTSGVSSVGHLSVERVALELGIKLIHVPYRGSADVEIRVLGGELDFGALGMEGATRNLKPLLVFSDKRVEFILDVPTSVERGLPPIPPGYQGLIAPKGTPPAIIAALEKACEESVNSVEFRAFGAKSKQKVAYLKGSEFSRIVKEDYEFKGKVIRDAKISLQQ